MLLHRFRRRRLLALPALLAGAFAPALLHAQPRTLQAPNVVVIGPTLVTSGQPSREALAGLGALGFEAVISLVPFDVPGAVPDEGALLKRQGIAFVHVPIPFGAPREQHYTAVAEALQRLSGRRVLVHCEVNMRASSMVFLYRAVALQQPPAEAYDAVARVWSPRGPWRELIVAVLARHGIAFEPY